MSPIVATILGFVGVLGAMIIGGFAWQEYGKTTAERNWRGFGKAALIVAGLMTVAGACLYLTAVWPSN